MMQNKRLRIIGEAKKIVSGLMLSVLLSGSAWAQTWINVAPPGFPAEANLFLKPSLALSAAGTPYLAYMDFEKRGMISVMKFEGGAWVPVGARGFSPKVGVFPSLALSAAGVPYVVYKDNRSDELFVMKFEGETWVPVGAPLTLRQGSPFVYSLSLSSAGVPYVFFEDGTQKGKISLVKFENGDWVSAGTPGSSQAGGDFPSLSLSAAGVPYVAYSNWSNPDFKLSVMKFEGDAWASVGIPGFSSGWLPSLSLSVAGVPYVAYVMGGDFKEDTLAKLSVIKFERGAWVSVGLPVGFSRKGEEFPSLAISAAGIPYMAYVIGNASDFRLSVMKFEKETWVSATPPEASSKKKATMPPSLPLK
jgi:hypothetical protein